MSNNDTTCQKEEPLDPAVEQIHIRLRRLLMGSGLIMVLGFAAVFAALYYRIMHSGENQASKAALSQAQPLPELTAGLILPSDIGSLIDVSLEEDHLVATFKQGTHTYHVLVVDRRDGAIIARYEWRQTGP